MIWNGSSPNVANDFGARIGVSCVLRHVAEITLFGVQEPRCVLHAPHESVDPSEIEGIAPAAALFIRAYADGSG